MAIVASKGASFVPCPAGSHVSVCCDVVDLGIVKTQYKDKVKAQHKIFIVWQTPEKNDEGKYLTVRKRYTLSLHERSTLRKDLESWRGRAFTEEELNGWDVENVLGVPCMLSVVHAAVNGKVYANVAAIMKAPKGISAPEIDPSYVRVQDRPKDDGEVPPESGEWSATDDDVPF